MTFDPDKYLNEKKPSSGFDPDAYLKDKAGPQDISKLESGIRGAAQGLTFGLAPALTGAAETLPEASGLISGSKSLFDLLASYDKAREASKAKYDAAQKANPISSFAGNMIGGLAPAIATGGATEGLTGLQGIKLAAATGATAGGLSGAGNAVSGGEDAGQGIKDTLSGALGGAALGGVLGGVGKLGKNLLNGAASTETGSTLGGAYKMGTEGDNLLKQSTRNSIGKEGYDLAEDYIGKSGKFRNLLKQKGADVGNAVDAEAGNLTDVKDEGLLGTLEDHINSLDERDPKQMADKQRFNEIVQNFTGAPGEDSASVGQLDPKDIQGLKSVISNLSPFGDDALKSQEGANISKLMSKAIGEFNEDQVPGLENANDVYNSLKNAMKMLKVNPKSVDTQKQIENLGNIIYRLKNTTKTGDLSRLRFNKGIEGLSSVDPDMASEFQQQAMDTAKRIEIARKATAESFPGSGIVNTIKGASVKSANAVGLGSKAVSDALSSTSKTLSEAAPESLVNFGQQLSQSLDPIAKRLGNVLSKAGDKDDIGRNALIFSLMQNPAYREILRSYSNGGNNAK